MLFKPTILILKRTMRWCLNENREKQKTQQFTFLNFFPFWSKLSSSNYWLWLHGIRCESLHQQKRWCLQLLFYILLLYSNLLDTLWWLWRLCVEALFWILCEDCGSCVWRLSLDNWAPSFLPHYITLCSPWEMPIQHVHCLHLDLQMSFRKGNAR